MSAIFNLVPADVIAWLIGAIATTIAGWLAAILNRFVKIRIDDKRQKDLKNAIESAIKWIIAQDGKGGLSRTITLEEGVDYVKQSVPEAWEHFGAPALVVRQQIEGGLQQARDLLKRITG